MIKTATSLGAEMALKIIEEGKRPMSPAQIKAKYHLEFPFTVKRVVKGSLITSQCTCGVMNNVIEVGTVLTFTREVGSLNLYVFEGCGCPGNTNGIDKKIRSDLIAQLNNGGQRIECQTLTRSLFYGPASSFTYDL